MCEVQGISKQLYRVSALLVVFNEMSVIPVKAFKKADRQLFHLHELIVDLSAIR